MNTSSTFHSKPLPSLQQIRLLVESNSFTDALEMIDQLADVKGNNTELLKLKAFIFKAQSNFEEYLQQLEIISQSANNIEDQEYYIYELWQLNQQQKAHQLKRHQLQNPQYCQKLAHFLQHKHPLILANQQFFHQYSRQSLKKSLHEIATTMIADSEKLERCQWFIDNLFNLNAFYQQSENSLHRPSYLAYGHLNNRPFIDDDEIIAKQDFSEIHQTIIEMVHQLIVDNDKELVPYVKNVPGAPKCLEHLKGNKDWSSLVICSDGQSKVKNGENLITLLRQHFSLADLSPMAPEVMISILKPGTHIKPHFGITNIKQTLHIPIVIPKGDLGIKVADETRTWHHDFPILFDDSFQHEAWNFSNETRIVLIVDVWHPSLSLEERKFLTQSYPMITRCFSTLTKSTRLQGNL